jgi:hypothetical protein
MADVRSMALLAAVSIITSSCASKLAVFDASANPSTFRGIRVHQRVPYILTKEIETEKCPPKTEESIIYLPIGNPYDIRFDPAQLAKSEFTIVLTDDGGLRQVTLNSTPQVAEAIKSVGELAEKVSKFAIAPAGVASCGALLSEKVIGARKLPIGQK